MGRASHVIEEPSDVEIDLTSELEELRDAKSTPDEFVSEPGKWKGPKGTYVLENAMDNDLHNHVHVVTKLNDDGTKTGRYLIKKVRMSLMNDEGNILESLGELVDEWNGHIVIKYHEGVELHSYLFDLFDHWNADNHEPGTPIPPLEAAKIVIKDGLQGLYDLNYQKSIFHNDAHLGNILVSSDGTSTTWIDFDASTFLDARRKDKNWIVTKKQAFKEDSTTFMKYVRNDMISYFEELPSSIAKVATEDYGKFVKSLSAKYEVNFDQ